MRALRMACACLIVSAGGAQAQNLLTNGSFTGSLNGWTNGGFASYDPTLDATGTAGSGSAKALAPAATGVNGVLQCIAVAGSTQYKAGGKILIPLGQSSSGSAEITIVFFSSPGCSTGEYETHSSPYVTNGGSWTAVDTGFITSPADAQSVRFTTGAENHSSAGSASVQVNFDDLYLVAGGPSYSRWIPAVIHKDVTSKNAKWRSDVAVLNRSTSMANLTITMFSSLGGMVGRGWFLYPNSQIILTDVAGWLGVAADSGPLEVVSDQDFFLSGRTYNQVDATHTYGQDYDGQAPSELLGATQSAWLPQLTENALYRTNIGITNTGTETANVTLTLYNESGNQVWTDTRDYGPGVFYQYQQPYLAFGGIASGYAMVTVNEGSGVVAYASVVDANTNDPTTITMKR